MVRELAMMCSIIGLVMYTIGMTRNFGRPTGQTKKGWFYIAIPVWAFGVGYFVCEQAEWI